MKKHLPIIALIFCISTILIVFYSTHNNKHQGMSIVIEEQSDIPLYKGLKPNQSYYKIAGNKVHTIYKYYEHQLKINEWDIISDNYYLNSYSFETIIDKDDFDGEIHIYGSYDSFNNVTKIKFDHVKKPQNTRWFYYIPKQIIVYDYQDNSINYQITDVNEVAEIIKMIDEDAYDVYDIQTQPKYGLLKYDDFQIEVHFAEESVYFKSEKGLKKMKLNQDFNEITHMGNE